ncbi:hypothetical protein F2Q68_00034365 [Brassica cretica]|uniref:Uncharacterized protein n=1 Tax=Brassica cretica TaxID=69181 RepID=A0A8S9H2P7_BRACR|nr:hypothetical protein F2Q68_00034365 [Brassica cretica]
MSSPARQAENMSLWSHLGISSSWTRTTLPTRRLDPRRFDSQWSQIGGDEGGEEANPVVTTWAGSRRRSQKRTIAIFSKSSNPMAKNLSGGCVIGVCTVVFPRQEKNLCHSRQQSAVACDASGKAEGFLAFDRCGGSQVASLDRASFILHRCLSEELNEVDKPSISISHARAR